MKLSRTLAVLVVSTLLAMIVAPLSASAQGTVPGVGTTSTSLQLVDVSLTEVPQLGELRAALGLANTEATTVDDTLASVLFNGVTVGSQTSGSQEVTSSDGLKSQEVTVPLAGPGIDGSLTIAKLSANATPETAIALLSALSGNVDVGPLGLSATVGENGIKSEVLGHIASSSTGAGLGPIELKVGDLLPAELLGALPLSALLDLTDGLNLNLSGTIDAQLQTLRDALATLDTLQGKLDELEAAKADLNQLISGNQSLLAQIEDAQGDVNAAAAALATTETALADAQAALAAAIASRDASQTQLTELQTELAGLQSDLGAAQTLLAACPALCGVLQGLVDALNAQISAVQTEIVAAQTQLTGAEADVVAAQTAVTAVQANLAAAQAELAGARAALNALLAGLDADAIKAVQDLINTLQALIDDLLAQLQDLLGQLPDLSTLIDSLADLLGDAPLLSVERLGVAVSTTANSVKGTADVECGATGVSVLGQSLGTLTCGQLGGQFDELTGGIIDVLRDLPVVGGGLPQVTVEGLKSNTSASDAPDAAGRTSSTASLSALHIGIPSVELDALVDTLVADAITQIEGVVASLPAGSTEVQTLLNTIKGQLTALPTGAVLDGLKTVGIDAVLGGLTSRSSFQAAARPVTNPPVDNPPVDNPPVDNPPVDNPLIDNPQPQNRPSVAAPAPAPLPFTGSSALPIAWALGLVMTGTLLMASTRRRNVTDLLKVPSSEETH